MLDIAVRVVAMNTGRVIAEGTPAEILANSDVVAAYMGTDDGPA